MPDHNNNLHTDDDMMKTDVDVFLDHLAHLIARRHLERSAQDSGTTKPRRPMAKKKNRRVMEPSEIVQQPSVMNA
jgi:hypothetical protein